MPFLKHKYLKNTTLNVSKDVHETGKVHLNGEGVFCKEDGSPIDFEKVNEHPDVTSFTLKDEGEGGAPSDPPVEEVSQIEKKEKDLLQLVPDDESTSEKDVAQQTANKVEAENAEQSAEQLEAENTTKTEAELETTEQTAGQAEPENVESKTNEAAGENIEELQTEEAENSGAGKSGKRGRKKKEEDKE